MQKDDNLDMTLSQEQEDKLKKLFAIDPNKQIADFQVPSTFNQAKLQAQQIKRKANKLEKISRLLGYGVIGCIILLIIFSLSSCT